MQDAVAVLRRYGLAQSDLQIALWNRLAVATLLLGVCAVPVSAQSRARWTTIYVGGDVGTSFGAPNFTVDFDATPGHFCCLVEGTVSPGVTVGARVGLTRQFGDAFVVGGEVGFGKLGYYGEASELGWSFGEIRGGLYWSATGRIGYAVADVMIYGGGGVWTGTTSAQSRKCDPAACGTIIAEGSNNLSTTSPIIVAGLEIAPGRRTSGLAWSIRVEWVQFFGEEIVNAYDETVISGPGAPRPGPPVEFLLRPPPGMIRVLVDFGIKR